MDNTIDLNEVDKTNFKCFKFQDGSLYYGELAYVDPVNDSVLLESDLDSLTDEKIKTLKVVRHGLGAQLFYVTSDSTCLCKYEGEWAMDKKNGRGICNFPDRSVYEGTFVNDLFDGYGKYVWPNNDVFIGQWKGGRMEGEGEFKHHDGHILKGCFKNNYYFDVSVLY